MGVTVLVLKQFPLFFDLIAILYLKILPPKSSDFLRLLNSKNYQDRYQTIYISY